MLGTWQGVFLAEHRRMPHRRTIVAHLLGIRTRPSARAGSGLSKQPPTRERVAAAYADRHFRPLRLLARPAVRRAAAVRGGGDPRAARSSRANSRMSGAEHIARIAAQDGIGERIWLHVEGRCEVTYTAQRRDQPAAARHRHARPARAARAAGRGGAVPVQFALLPGRPLPAVRRGRVRRDRAAARGSLAIRDWIAGNFSYDAGLQRPATRPRSTASSSGAGSAATMPTC